MMPALRLEVFDIASAADGTFRPLVEATAVEEAKVASFEQGYSAGWDDAVAAQQGIRGASVPTLPAICKAFPSRSRTPAAMCFRRSNR